MSACNVVSDIKFSRALYTTKIHMKCSTKTTLLEYTLFTLQLPLSLGILYFYHGGGAEWAYRQRVIFSTTS